jgi:hypothetical protein
MCTIDSTGLGENAGLGANPGLGAGAGSGTVASTGTSVMLNSIGSIYRVVLFLTVFNSASNAYIAEAKLALG